MDAPSSSLFEHLLALKSVMQAQLGDGLEDLALLELTVPQAMVVFRLAHAAPMTMTELQAVARRSQAAASALVAQLEARGFLRRRPHPEDARKVLVEIDTAGTRCVQEIDDRRRAALLRLVKRLPPDLIQDLTRDLTRAREVLETDDRAPTRKMRRGAP